MPTMRIDLAKFPVLKALRASGSLLEFTGVENPRQLESADGLVTLPVGEARVGGFAGLWRDYRSFRAKDRGNFRLSLRLDGW